MDVGHERTEDILRRMEQEIAKHYKQAEQDVSEKYQDYLRRFEIKDRTKRSQVERGVITEEEYKQWKIGQIAVGKRWEEMRDALAADYVNADKIARSIAHGYMADVYALNHNYATFMIERDGLIDTSYSLYSREVVERLIREKELTLMPPPKVGGKTWLKLKEHPDLIWNKQHLQSALLQGILQGESIPAMAKRVEEVGEMNHRAAIRNARTMATGVQNKGRYDAVHRAKDLGVKQVVEWSATLDNRTRRSHREMDGQRREVDEPFLVDGKEILYPGYPEAPQEEIWNCRCTMLVWVKGFEGDRVTESPKMNGLSYDEWLEEKPKSNPITLPEKKAQAIKASYIEGYKR